MSLLEIQQQVTSAIGPWPRELHGDITRQCALAQRTLDAFVNQRGGGTRTERASAATVVLQAVLAATTLPGLLDTKEDANSVNQIVATLRLRALYATKVIELVKDVAESHSTEPRGNGGSGTVPLLDVPASPLRLAAFGVIVQFALVPAVKFTFNHPGPASSPADAATRRAQHLASFAATIMDLNDGALIPCAIQPLPYAAGSDAVAAGMDKKFAHLQRESIRAIFIEMKQICESREKNREVRMATLCAPKFVEPSRLLQIFKESRDNNAADLALACLTKVTTCKAPSAEVTTTSFLQVLLDLLAAPTRLHGHQRWTLAYTLWTLVEHNSAPIARTLRSIRGVGGAIAVALNPAMTFSPAAGLQSAAMMITGVLLRLTGDKQRGSTITTAAEADELCEAAVALLQHHYHTMNLVMPLSSICEDIMKASPAAAAGPLTRACAGAIRDAVAKRAPTQFELLRLFSSVMLEAAHTTSARATVASVLQETNALELLIPLLSPAVPRDQVQFACWAIGEFVACGVVGDGTVLVRSGLLPLLTRCAAALNPAVTSLDKILSAPFPTDVTRYLVEKCKILPVFCELLRLMQPDLCEMVITCIRLAVAAAENARLAPLNEYGRNPYWALCAERYGINDTLDKIGGDKSINKNHPAVARAALQLKGHNNTRLSTRGSPVDEADTARYIKYAAQQSKGWRLSASDYDGDYGVQTQTAVDVSHKPASAAPAAMTACSARSAAAPASAPPVAATVAAKAAAAPLVSAPSEASSSGVGVPVGSWRFSKKKVGDPSERR